MKFQYQIGYKENKTNLDISWGLTEQHDDKKFALFEEFVFNILEQISIKKEYDLYHIRTYLWILCMVDLSSYHTSHSVIMQSSFVIVLGFSFKLYSTSFNSLQNVLHYIYLQLQQPYWGLGVQKFYEVLPFCNQLLKQIYSS